MRTLYEYVIGFINGVYDTLMEKPIVIVDVFIALSLVAALFACAVGIVSQL